LIMKRDARRLGKKDAIARTQIMELYTHYTN
jgi:hypothetical protein